MIQAPRFNLRHLLFFTLPVLAHFFILQARAETSNFIPVDRLPKEQKAKLKPAIDASFQFRLEPGVNCTGTYISSTGHFLTALHCVSACLARHAAIQTQRATEEPVREYAWVHKKTGARKEHKLYSFTKTVNRDKIAEGLICPAKIGERSVQVQIVMTGGEGWLTPKSSLPYFSRRFPDDYQYLLNNGYEHGYDFAVMRVTSTTPTPCVSMADQGPSAPSRLQSISFACLDRATLETDGQAALYTTGRKTLGFRESVYYRHHGDKLLFNPDLLERSDTFFSTLDMEKCGSGSGILNEEFKIVGIATRVYKSTKDYEFGSLESVDIARVWKEIKLHMSPKEVKTITSCESPRPLSKIPFSRVAGQQRAP